MPRRRIGTGSTHIYSPGAEYDLHAVFKRLAQKGDVGPILLIGNEQLFLTLSGWESTKAGLQMIDGRLADRNDTAVAYKLANNVVHDLTVSVRSKSIRVVLDGKELLSYSHKDEHFSLDGAWDLRNRHALGWVCSKAACEVRTLEVLNPVTH